jgi:protocatechuate 3,4-dioxygenase beta subunit
MKDDHRDPGLARDLQTLLRRASRRDFLRLMAGAGLAPLVGCGADGGRNGSPAGGDSSSCAPIPEETAGPFPGDGSNGANALELSGIVRSDIRSSIAGASGTAEGALLTVSLTLVDAGGGCAPLVGRAVYVWQCDREGRYSMYSPGVTDENYLRGVQVSDDAGAVTFTTVFPGCYPGRWPHIHFAVYPGVDAIGSGSEIATSQLALPAEACEAVYATTGYDASIEALAQISLESDGVFADDGSRQLASTSGGVAGGYTAVLEVPIQVSATRA